MNSLFIQFVDAAKMPSSGQYFLSFTVIDSLVPLSVRDRQWA